jgi:hypothetical protein
MQRTTGAGSITRVKELTRGQSKRTNPGTENTRNSTDNARRRRIRMNINTEKNQSNNVQRQGRLLNLIYFTAHIDMTYDYRPTRRRHPQAPIYSRYHQQTPDQMWTRLPYHPRQHHQTPRPIGGSRPRRRATARRSNTIDQALMGTMVAILLLITLSLTIGKARGQLGHEQRQFTAYDCTSPQELKAVTKGEPPQCQDRLDQEPIKQRNQTYLLLQKATYRRQPVSRCKVIRTRMAHHCGDSDHQTYIPQFSTFRARVTISAGQ